MRRICTWCVAAAVGGSGSAAAHAPSLCPSPAPTAPRQKLLDGLETEIDKGNSGLQRETARIEYVIKDARTCWLYVAICVLFLVLIALVVAKWGVPHG
jgi:hypothetical protein